MAKRYKTGLHPEYDDFFDVSKDNSSIFNTGRHFDISSFIPTKENCASQIYDFEKNLIPNVTGELEELENRYKSYCQQKINEGRRAPERMPSDLESKKFKLEASEDVYNEELTYLKKRLTEFQKVIEIQAGKPLLNGCQGIGRLQDGFLAVLDGQVCSRIKEGIIIIDDPRSKYCGLACYEYYERVIPAFRELEKERKLILLKNVQESQRKQGLPIPQNVGQLGVCNYGAALDPGMKLPDWPEGARNWKQPEIEEKKPEMKRTKKIKK